MVPDDTSKNVPDVFSTESVTLRPEGEAAELTVTGGRQFLSVCYRKAYPAVSNSDDWRTGARSPQYVPGGLIEPIGGSIEAGGLAGSSWLIRSARVPSSSFNAVGLGFLPRVASSLYFASLAPPASPIAGNLPGNIPPHVVIP